jgi:pimeloyl-ACP methyl ester carboxylesterase
VSRPELAGTWLTPHPDRPLLAVGPALGTTVEALWGRCARELAGTYAVLGWDLPGHGRSPAPDGPVDQFGQVIDVMATEQRDTAAARRFFTRALRYGPVPVEVTTDKAGPYLRVIDELVPAAAHVTEQYRNNRIEADHARLKARPRPMRGLKQLRSAARIAAGHAFMQNLRRGHYELATNAPAHLRLAEAFTELALAI